MTAISVIVMVVASLFGCFTGAFVNDMAGGGILFALIAGIACVIYVLDHRGKT